MLIVPQCYNSTVFTIIQLYILASLVILGFSFLADITDNSIGAKRWYRAKVERYKFMKVIDKASPLRPFRWLFRLILTYPRTASIVGVLICFHVFLHLANPYAQVHWFETPYKTAVNATGEITYEEVYEPLVLADPVSDIFGYYRSGFLIAQNTLFGGQPIKDDSSSNIIAKIHQRRFDPSKPYLISGDQFSVLYPRNLGVFYNQLLDPNTALSEADWENRQRIYLQSVLFAINGLSAGDTPKTTLVPVAPRTVAATSVHPGDIASDAVYGTLYALNQLNSVKVSRDKRYEVRTHESAQRILKDKSAELTHMVRAYVTAVQDPVTKLIKTDVHLASARDGASRRSSFYDNVILWKTLALADTLGIVQTSKEELTRLKQTIETMYWNETAGYYNNDAFDDGFSSDWLIGYVTGFFDLESEIDLERTIRTIDYINKNGLADPLPIKYQNGKPNDMPWVIKLVVPTYGGEAIWSYWGSEYITLLINMHKVTGDEKLMKQAARGIELYEKAIVRDGGFAETFDADGNFLESGLYKSIRITGWVVQFEHAKYEYARVGRP